MDKAIVCTPEDIVLRRVRPQGSAVVVGGGNTGLECVELLQDDGVRVTVVELLDQVELLTKSCF